jgi:hypothetical protein
MIWVESALLHYSPLVAASVLALLDGECLSEGALRPKRGKAHLRDGLLAGAVRRFAPDLRKLLLFRGSAGVMRSAALRLRHHNGGHPRPRSATENAVLLLCGQGPMRIYYCAARSFLTPKS